MSENIHHDQSGGNHSPKALAITVDSGRSVNAVAICAALSAICACFAIFAFYQATLAERESRMASYYITELDMTLSQLKVERPGGGYEAFKRSKE